MSVTEALDEGKAHVPEAERLSLYSLDGAVVSSCAGPALSLNRPLLWWPNGSGSPHTYRLVAQRGSQERSFSIGFRSLELVPNPGAPAGARPYTFRVNGREIFAKGWNWVPIDALYGVPRPTKLAHLLGLAAASGANLVRVWGGGLLETAEFYDLCDRLGLMVWQEFSLSSSGMGSVPSAEPRYLATMANEAPIVVAERRHHPSLALWCGGNELAASAPDRDDIPLDEACPVIALLAGAVAEHDRGRPFLPTSPSGPHFLNRLDIIEAAPDGQHDVHGPWEHQGLVEHNRLYDAGTCLLHSEVGVEAMANRRGLARLVSAGHQWPAGRQNPVYEHLGAWWDNEPLVQECFGGRLDDLAQLRRASQQLQYDGLRYVVESRLRKAPRTSGVLPWQFNEPYPNAWCTCAVDWWGEPKPAYYGVKRAYRAAHVCAAFDRWAWGGQSKAVLSVHAWPQPARVEAELVDIYGARLARHQWATPVGDWEVALDGAAPALVVLCLSATMADGLGVANRYVLSTTNDLSPLLDLAEADIEVVAGGGGLTLANVGKTAALGIVAEDDRDMGAPGWAVFEDNVLDLLPGEQACVGVKWVDAPPGDRSVVLSGWGLSDRRISLGTEVAR